MVVLLILLAVIAGIFLYLYFTTVSIPRIDELIIIDYPKPNAIIGSPLKVSGQARGNWYFEASAPVKIVDDLNNVLGVKYITAQGDWMTTDFVPFLGEIEFAAPNTPAGKVIFQKDNPSGLPENDRSVEISVRFR